MRGWGGHPLGFLGEVGETVLVYVVYVCVEGACGPYVYSEGVCLGDPHIYHGMREGKLPLRTVLENFINHVDTLEAKRSEGSDQYEVEFQVSV